MNDDVVRSIVDGNAYMTLATADEHGNPWACPVWYATTDYREFIWVSTPGRRHSRNIAVRPELSVVIFDSHQLPGTSAAVYLMAHAELVPPRDVDRCLRIFSSASTEQGLPAWTRATIEPPARLRLYHASVSEHFLLSSTEERVPVVMPV